MTEQKLKLNNKHPDYARMELCWLKAMDFLRCGEAVLSPNHITGKYWSAISGGQAEGNDSDDTQKVKWAASDCKSYLYRHETETDGEYYNRQIRATHWPLFSPVLNIFAAGILRTPPKRSGADAEPWSSFHRNTDRTGTSFDAFIRQALVLGLASGRIHAITDMPEASGDRLVSLADQQAKKISPYTYLVEPIDLVDWLLDEDGNFIWAVVQEKQSENRAPGQPRGNALLQYRVWTRDGWTLWRADEKDNWFEVGGKEHKLNEVPISTMYTSRFHTMDCESPLASLLSMDCRLFNKLSEQDTLERFCGFPILGIPSDPDMKPARIDLGPARAVTFPAGTGGPVWISPDPSHAQDSWTRNKDALMISRLVGGVSRGKAEDSMEARSAAAIGAESEEKRTQMTEWSCAVEEFDASIHRHVAKWMGIDPEKVPAPSYERNFDLRATEQQINDVLQIGAVRVVPSAVLAELIKPVIEKIMRENGAPAEAIEDAKAAVDQAAVEANKVISVPERSEKVPVDDEDKSVATDKN